MTIMATKSLPLFLLAALSLVVSAAAGNNGRQQRRYQYKELHPDSATEAAAFNFEPTRQRSHRRVAKIEEEKEQEDFLQGEEGQKIERREAHISPVEEGIKEMRLLIPLYFVLFFLLNQWRRG